MESKMTSLNLPVVLDEQIKKLAQDQGESKSSIIQEALRQYISRQHLFALEQKMQAKARQLKLESEDDVVSLIHKRRQARTH